MPSLNGRTESRSQLALLSVTRNWRVEKRPLDSPRGQMPGLGLATDNEKTTEEQSKRNIEKGPCRVQSAPTHQ